MRRWRKHRKSHGEEESRPRVSNMWPGGHNRSAKWFNSAHQSQKKIVVTPTFEKKKKKKEAL